MNYWEEKGAALYAKYLHRLTWRENEVLKLRNGLNGGRYTLEEVGLKFKITREKVRIIEAKAHRKLMRWEEEKDSIDFKVNMTMAHHVHINHFGDSPPDTIEEIKRSGFSVKETVSCLENKKRKMWLMGYEYDDGNVSLGIYRVAVAILLKDPTFHGYMELEMLLPGYEMTFEEKKYNPRREFPIREVRFVDGKKKADVHIFRDYDGQGDRLDQLLLDNGFYEVRTPKSRIWTLLVGSLSEFHHYRRILPEYFRAAGGVKKLEFEIVGRMDASPGFELPKVTSGEY